LIKLVNGFLRQRVVRAREPLALAIENVQRAATVLRALGIAGLDPPTPLIRDQTPM
jgi:hypothetical protein